MVWAATPAPLTTLHEIRQLSNAQADHLLPVAFEATVTYFREYENTLFVQDGGDAIYVSAPRGLKLVPGDRVLVRGKTKGSFKPYIADASITLLSHQDLPQPRLAGFDEMMHADTDCMLVSVHGTVRTADITTSLMAPVRSINLQINIGNGFADANVDNDSPEALNDLLDAEVELVGVAAEKFDPKMQQTGVLLHIQSLKDIKVLHRSAVSPWSAPVTPMNRVLDKYSVQELSPRARVHGTITYYEPGYAVVLQNGDKSIWISTNTRIPLQLGDSADAIGFPAVHDGFISLAHAEIQDEMKQAPIQPITSTWKSLTPVGQSAPGHHYDLVSIEGRVVTEVRVESQDEYILAADGKQFSAVFRHLDFRPVAKQVPIGSKLRVTGICILEDSNPFIAEVPFRIMMRSYDDIEVIERPSLVNIRNLMILIGVLLVLVALAVARGWMLDRRVRQQTVATAIREQQRSRILEDINAALPLTEIIQHICEMISFKLKGEYCWCEIADGARLGSMPFEGHGLRVVRKGIPGRGGSLLGVLFVAADPRKKAPIDEQDALAVGARLAALAIETRRLYSDLHHRSEFDLLTDIHNRFSLHSHLESLIEEAHMNAALIGLIYIDLDKFKQINDRYGHHIGDLFLQESARRMKRQLRGQDILARLGGDEFAALVSVVRSRSEVEEIAQRLERCFDAPFVAEGYLLRGGASVGIALYPEDATTKDNLLNAADAAMYDAKNRKRKLEKGAAEAMQGETLVENASIIEAE